MSSYLGFLCVDGDDPSITPKALELIKVAQRGVEDVHDKVDVCLGSYYLKVEFWILDGPRLIALLVGRFYALQTF